MNNIFKIAKVLTLALVLSVGMSYALAWTAPASLPPAGNVSAPINTGSIAQTKAGAIVLDLTGNSSSGGRDALFIKASADNLTGVILANKPTITFWNTVTNTLGDISAKSGIFTGTVQAGLGYLGNGSIPLTPHYVNRSEDTYGGAFTWSQYCNGFYNHDTCNGDYNNPYSCPKSANIASCVDQYPTTMPRTDFGWCGSYFYDRIVSCKTNEVLSTYDDNI